MRCAGLLIVAVATGSVGVGAAWAQTDGGKSGGSTERLGAALDALGKGNPVLARVGGHEIRWADVEASVRDLPEGYQGRIEAILPALLGRLIDRRLLVIAGREAGLAEDPDVRQKVTDFEDRAISEAFAKQKINAAIDTKAIRARYEAYRQQVAGRAEVRARHILLSSREAALDVIAKLNEGADFSALARSRSLAPSADKGGDVGYFSRDSMAPDFAEMAFRLPVGGYSPAPLETKFGWHVIKVEDRREETPRSFFEMRGELRQEISRELIEREISKLRRKADIELFPEASNLPE